jgi:hypothetical protein
MKHTIIILLLCASAFAGGSCTTLYHHGDHDITLCHTEDPESYTSFYYTGDQISSESVTFDRYAKMMEDDTKDFQEHMAQVDAANTRYRAEVDAILSASRARAGHAPLHRPIICANCVTRCGIANLSRFCDFLESASY